VKIFARLAPLAWLLPFDFAQAACEPRVDPVQLLQPAPPIARSEVRSLVVTPSEGTPLHADSVVAIDLEYRIADFSKGDYMLAPLFKSGNRSSKTIDFDGKESSVPLDYPAGKVRLCLPLAQIYGADAKSVVWPLELNLMLLKSDGRGGAIGKTGSRPIKLNTVDSPVTSLEHQGKALPVEYEDALEHTFGHFSRNEGLYKVCLRRIPAMQPTLTPAYRSWEARHRADIEFVSGLKFERLKEENNGRADIAMRVIDVIADAHEQDFTAFALERLRDSCNGILEEANPEDDPTEGIVGSQLAVLRKWQGKL
jgi:hypothetical protein